MIKGGSKAALFPYRHLLSGFSKKNLENWSRGGYICKV
mgnify:CR=1 FL=1